MRQMHATVDRRLLAMENNERLPEEPIIGPNKRGAQLVRVALGSQSSRGAALKMANRGYVLNHSTINNMRNGQSAESDSVIKFARAFNLDVDVLLEAFGHHTTERNPKSDEVQPIEYVSDPGEQEVLRYYRGVPEELKPLARDSLRPWVTAGDLVAQRERARTIGKRAEDDPSPDQEIGSDEG